MRIAGIFKIELARVLDIGKYLQLLDKRNVEAIEAFDHALAIDANHETAIKGRKFAVEALKAQK